MRKLAALVIVLGLVGNASAATFTASLVLPGDTTVAAGGSVDIEVHGVLDTAADNDGLVFVSVDATVSGPSAIDAGTAISWAEPGDGSMDKFVRDLGYDATYGGTPLSGDLLQSGGAQNTIGNDPTTGPMLPFPSAEFIDFGVAHSNQVILAGTITFPLGTVDDVYTVCLENVLANVLADNQSVSSFGVYSVEAATSVAGPCVEITVQSCAASGVAPPVAGVSFHERAWDGYIDSARESNNGADINQGMDSITIEFATGMANSGGGAISAAAFSVSDTGGSPPAILSATSSDGGVTVTLQFDGFLSLQEWTTIDFDGQNACSGEGFVTSMDIGTLPCDVTQDGKCNPLDVTRFRQYVNEVLVPAIGVETDFTDINRDGGRNPLDLTALRQLVFGTGVATKVWASEELPAQP